MKVKDYLELQEELKSNSRKIDAHYSKSENTIEEYNNIQIVKNRNEEIEKEFKIIPTVYVSFYIGYRSYYREVRKIGKSYFTHGEKMTKNRGGYRDITEIEEITNEMKDEMLSDLYYY